MESEVKFDEDKYRGMSQSPKNITSKMVECIMKCSGGLIKEERHAEYVILGIIMILIFFAFYLFFTTSSTKIDKKYIYNPNTPADTR